MQICLLDKSRAEAWNTFAAREHAFTLLQSWQWGVFKEQLGWKVYRLVVEDAGEIIAGAQLLVKPLPLGLAIAYVPRGPIGKWLEDDIAPLLLPGLIRLAGANHAVFLKIEPAVQNDPEARALLERYKFRHSHTTNQPQTTILLDLSQTQEKVLGQMRKKTRQYIHRAEREGITVRLGSSADLPAYHNLMSLTGKREHFAARSLKYYQAEWETFSASGHGVLFLAYYRDQLIAVRAVYYFGSHAAEFHAGSITVPGLHPNYLLVWEAIKWAVAKGCVTYDMWGIPDEIGNLNEDKQPASVDRDDGLWGVYQFKRGFSKNVVSYIGAYDYVFVPSLHFLFNSALSSGKWWERIAATLDTMRFGPDVALKLESHGENK